MGKRKAPSRAAKKDPYDLEQLLTSDKSKLIDIDLHGMLARFFSDPKNWAQVSNEDKGFIRSLLPPNVELDDNGSIPDDFWKYNPEFRLDCRNLQEDLRAGRMDPEWQREAHQAMEERAAGDFDNFKEREFEEFWGQKQKVDWKALAGDASKVRLDELLSAGLFKEGDVWSFSHTFGRRDEAVPIEKECRVVGIVGKTVTIAIPPGQRKFARRFDQPIALERAQAEAYPPSPISSPLSSIPSSTTGTADEDTTVRGITAVNEKPVTQIRLADDTKDADCAELPPEAVGILEGKAVDKHDATAEGDTAEGDTAKGDRAEGDRAEGDTTECRSTPPTLIETGEVEPEVTAMSVAAELGPITPKRSIKTTMAPTTPMDVANGDVSIARDYDVILWKGTGLFALEKKILEIDGRAKPESRTGSTWRDIRCRRNEQDLGSLFEMRDEYYAYKVEGKKATL
ncbi:MAG: hypothetical protein Q9223_006260 [Gallowayella weberi]